MSKDFVNEIGVVVGVLKIYELITIVEELDNRELRKKFLQLLTAMHESGINHLVLAYPPVRGKP